MRRFALTLCALLLASPAVAQADDPDYVCQFSHAVGTVSSLRQFPLGLAGALGADVRDRDEQPGTLDGTRIRPLPDPVQFIRGGNFGDIWFVWTRHGGANAFKRIRLYTFERATDSYKLLELLDTAPDLCAATDQLLDGAPEK
jgi:hypothetical protein